MPSSSVNVCRGVALWSLHSLCHHYQSWDLRRNVKFELLERLTHFDALLGIGVNTYCLPVRVGRSQNLVGVKRAIVLHTISSYSLNSVSKKFNVIYRDAYEWPWCAQAQWFPILSLPTKCSKYSYCTRLTTGPQESTAVCFGVRNRVLQNLMDSKCIDSIPLFWSSLLCKRWPINMCEKCLSIRPFVRRPSVR